MSSRDENNNDQKKYTATTGDENLVLEQANDKAAILEILQTFSIMRHARAQGEPIDAASEEFLMQLLKAKAEDYERISNLIATIPPPIDYTGIYSATTITNANLTPTRQQDAPAQQSSPVQPKTQAQQEEPLDPNAGIQKAAFDVTYFAQSKYLTPAVEKALVKIMPEAAAKVTSSLAFNALKAAATGEWSAGEIAIGAATAATGIGEAVELAMLLGTLYEDLYPAFVKSQEPIKVYTDMINAGFRDKNHPENTNPGQLDTGPAWKTDHPEWVYTYEPVSLSKNLQDTNDSTLISIPRDVTPEVDKIRRAYKSTDIMPNVYDIIRDQPVTFHITPKETVQPDSKNGISYQHLLTRPIPPLIPDAYNLESQALATPEDNPSKFFPGIGAIPDHNANVGNILKEPGSDVYKNALWPGLEQKTLPPAQGNKMIKATQPKATPHHVMNHQKPSSKQPGDKQHAVYNITIKKVHGSHIKAQHITETKEQTNTTTEALAIALRSAVVANQLHAG